MKRIGMFILLLTLCSWLISCGVEQPAGREALDTDEHTSPAASSPDSEPNIAILNQVADDLDLNPGFTRDIFSNGYICEDFGDVVIYRTRVFVRMHTNENVILLYFKDEKRYEPMDLEAYAFLEIDKISKTNDPDVLNVNFTNGIIPTGSEWIFKSFVGSLDYCISKKQVVEIEHFMSPGFYGYSSTVMTKQQFAQCRILDNKTAVFTFEALVDEAHPLPIDGPEILIPYQFEEGEPAVFLFRRTECTLSPQFTQQMQLLEGVQSAEFIYEDSPAFTGTKLTILPKEGYQVACRFNEDDMETSFQDFRIFCKNP